MRLCKPPLVVQSRPDDEERGSTTLVLPEQRPERGLERRNRGVLTVLSGIEVGAPVRVEASAPVTLGRAPDCTLSFVDQGLSRVHAEVRLLAGQFVIVDRRSRNGTFLNGQRITEGAPLSDGDRISLGAGTFLKFSLVSASEEEALRRTYEEATRDGLTGVFNRRQLEGRLAEWFEASQREGHGLSVAMVDVDHFKKVNDTHGHAAGDEVLRAVARVLREGVKVGQLVARYGGEEFTVVGRTDALTLGMTIDRLRIELRQREIVAGERTIRVTCSAGVAALDECDEPSPAALLRLADRRLYEAKHAGRDRVVGP